MYDEEDFREFVEGEVQFQNDLELVNRCMALRWRFALAAEHAFELSGIDSRSDSMLPAPMGLEEAHHAWMLP